MKKLLKKSDKPSNSKKDLRKLNIKYLKNGSYSIVYSAIFIAIIIVINLIVSAIPSRYTEIDLSESKLYSISDDTLKVLDALDKDVEIYQVTTEGNEDDTISRLLQRYDEESDHITTEVIDPVVNPNFTSQYTTANLTYNSMIVVCGDKSKVVDYNNIYETEVNYETYSYETTGFDGEGQITSAISYVTSDTMPILYCLTGHQEYELSSPFKEDVEKANIEIQSLNLITADNVPEDAACLLIAMPASDISKEEEEKILDYLEGGGKAMIFTSYTDADMTNMKDLLENYGVETVDGIVLEGDANHYAMQMPYYTVPDIGQSEAVSSAKDSGYYILAVYPQGIRRLDEIRDSLNIESILTTSDSAFSKVNTNESSIEKSSDDIDGPFDLAVSISEDVSDGQTQIVYYSTGYLLDSSANSMVSGGNEQLIMASLNWMVSNDDAETVTIPSKNLQVSYLTLTTGSINFWMFVSIALIPGFFLITGFVVWLMRRKA